MLVADVEPPCSSIDMGEPLACLAHDRRVDNGYHLVDVLEHETVEEGLVPVMQRRQIDVLFDIVGLDGKVLITPFKLFLHGAASWRKKTMKIQLVSLAGREGRSLVRQRVQQKGLALLRYRHVFLPACRVNLDTEAHCDATSLP
jgi:hypothetical protein